MCPDCWHQSSCSCHSGTALSVPDHSLHECDMRTHLDAAVQGWASSVSMTMIRIMLCRSCTRPRCALAGNRVAGLWCGPSNSSVRCARISPYLLLDPVSLGILLRFIRPHFCPRSAGTQFHRSGTA